MKVKRKYVHYMLKPIPYKLMVLLALVVTCILVNYHIRWFAFSMAQYIRSLQVLKNTTPNRLYFLN